MVTFFSVIGEVSDDLEQQLLSYADGELTVEVRRGLSCARAVNWPGASKDFAVVCVSEPHGSNRHVEFIDFARKNGLLLSAPTSDNIWLMPAEINRTMLWEVLSITALDSTLSAFLSAFDTFKVVELQVVEFATIVRLHRNLNRGCDWRVESALFSFMLKYGLNFSGTNLADDLGMSVTACVFGKTHAESNYLMRRGIKWLKLLQYVTKDELSGPQIGPARLSNIMTCLAAQGLRLLQD